MRGAALAVGVMVTESESDPALTGWVVPLSEPAALGVVAVSSVAVTPFHVAEA